MASLEMSQIKPELCLMVSKEVSNNLIIVINLNSSSIFFNRSDFLIRAKIFFELSKIIYSTYFFLINLKISLLRPEKVRTDGIVQPDRWTVCPLVQPFSHFIFCRVYELNTIWCFWFLFVFSSCMHLFVYAEQYYPSFVQQALDFVDLLFVFRVSIKQTHIFVLDLNLCLSLSTRRTIIKWLII